jgi:hypothetical protein
MMPTHSTTPATFLVDPASLPYAIPHRRSNSPTATSMTS